MPGIIDLLLSLPATYPQFRFELLGGLLLATVLGGAIGVERELSQKPAGLRTNILICLAATLLTDLSVEAAAASAADPTRIAAQIVTGVGFLGAGTIIQARGTVTGLTSAATLWIVATIGMAIGFGAVTEALGTTVLVLLILIPLRRVEAKLAAVHGGRRATDRASAENATPQS
jgi:putative Mg2+ transporter-C (MgtC) family protein